MPSYPVDPMPLSPSPPRQAYIPFPVPASPQYNNSDLQSVKEMPPREGGSSARMQDLDPWKCAKCGDMVSGTGRRVKKGKRVCERCYRRPPRAKEPTDSSKWKAGGPCALCGDTRAPAWRRGPNREKLCNACGLRVKFDKKKGPKDGKGKKDDTGSAL